MSRGTTLIIHDLFWRCVPDVPRTNTQAQNADAAGVVAGAERTRRGRLSETRLYICTHERTHARTHVCPTYLVLADKDSFRSSSSSTVLTPRHAKPSNPSCVAPADSRRRRSMSILNFTAPLFATLPPPSFFFGYGVIAYLALHFLVWSLSDTFSDTRPHTSRYLSASAIRRRAEQPCA